MSGTHGSPAMPSRCGSCGRNRRTSSWFDAWPDVHERYASAWGIDPEIGRRAYAAHPAT
jgi:hypothetical protein